MNTRIVLAITLVTQLYLSGQTAVANQTYQQALAELETSALDFIQAQEYVTVDPDTLIDGDYYSQKNFPTDSTRETSINLPDADLDPITRAMLLFESKEVSLPHARYRVTYSMNASTEVPEARHNYVEVTRYNLGPARRNDLLGSVPDGQVAGLEEFGIGPNISWRFVMMPVMGIKSDVIYASRKEVTEAQAQAADCLGSPCLALIDPQGPDRNWNSIPSPQLPAQVYSKNNNFELTAPTRVIEELWASISSDEMDILPYSKEQPQFEFVVSRNTFGQDDSVSALVKQFPVMDDSISEVWTRRIEIPNVPVEFANLYVPRR